MSVQLRIGRLGRSGDARPKAGATEAVADLPDALWRLLTSMRFALFIILIIALLSLIGTVLVQAPTGALSDAEAKRDWLNQVRPKYGGWTNVLDSLQFFTMFQSIWFKGLVALLTASLVACTVHRIPGVLMTVNRPHVKVGERFFEHAPQHEKVAVRGDGAALASTVAGVFRKHGFRTVIEDDGVVHFYGDRYRISQFAGLVGHLSLVVIFAGVMVGSMWGFRDSNFTVAEGSTATVPTAGGLAVKLVDFESAWYTDSGAPADYASEVVLVKDGAEVARQTVRVNDPLRYDGLAFYQSFYGPAAAMTVVDADGKQLFKDGVALAWTTQDGDRRIGSFSVPEKDLTIWVVSTSGSNAPLIRPGQAAVEVYNATTGSVVEQKTIDQGVPTSVGGLTITFDRELQFTGLTVARDPGTPLVWLGAFLLVGGFSIRMFLPFRRVWGRLAMGPDGRGTLAIAAPGTQDIGSDRAFTELVIDMRQACAPSLSA
jgi:cytochrome c biogenesis protein